MPLTCRLARTDELPALEKLVIDSFEPITWIKKMDSSFGPLNGHDWRDRWRLRLAHVFRTQILLVGEHDEMVVAFASGATDSATRVGFIDLLAVDLGHQGQGYGREMLRAMLAHLHGLGMLHANLECLADNERGNRLYESEGFTEVARSIRWFIRL